jgi:hypothetical protein
MTELLSTTALTQKTVTRISWEETFHIFGGAIAKEHLYPDADARVMWHMGHGDGEAAVVFEPHASAKIVAGLGALAPIAQLDDADEILALFKEGDDAKLQKAGNLSQKDMELATSLRDVGTLPLLVVLATMHLKRNLGLGRFRKLAKMLRDASNQNLQGENGWRLETVVPRAAARKAIADAKADITRMIGEPKKGKGWDAMPRLLP